MVTGWHQWVQGLAAGIVLITFYALVGAIEVLL